MKAKVLLLFLVALVQMMILISMVTVSALPLWTGKEVKIKTIPVDPRSLFRGNYALLRYDISEIQLTDLSNSNATLRQGEMIYVSLLQGDDGYYQMSTVSLKKPDSGIFVRGRIQGNRYDSPQDKLDVKYGIEAFFAPKEKALALEKQLTNGGVAVLMVSDSGKARLKDVIAP